MARLPLISYAKDGEGIFYNEPSNKMSNGKLGTNGSIRLRVGSNYLNLTPIQSAGQLFRGTYQAITDMKGGLVGDIDPLNHVNKVVDLSTSFKDWAEAGATTIAFDLSRSALLGNANTQTNNSRTAILELSGLALDGQSMELTIWAIMTKVANSSLENTIIDT